MRVEEEEEGDQAVDDELDGGLCAHLAAPPARADDHEAVEADEREQPRAYLQAREGEEAYPATPEERYLLEVAVERRHAQIVLEERVEIPLVEHDDVEQGEYGQVAHARVLAHVLPMHDVERGEIAHGADHDEHHRIDRQVLLVRIVVAVLAVLAKALEIHARREITHR